MVSLLIYMYTAKKADGFTRRLCNFALYSAVLIVLPFFKVNLIAPTLIQNIENSAYCYEHSTHYRKEHIKNLIGSDLIFFAAHKITFALFIIVRQLYQLQLRYRLQEPGPFQP